MLGSMTVLNTRGGDGVLWKINCGTKDHVGRFHTTPYRDANSNEEVRVARGMLHQFLRSMGQIGVRCFALAVDNTPSLQAH